MFNVPPSMRWVLPGWSLWRRQTGGDGSQRCGSGRCRWRSSLRGTVLVGATAELLATTTVPAGRTARKKKKNIVYSFMLTKTPLKTVQIQHISSFTSSISLFFRIISFFFFYLTFQTRCDRVNNALTGSLLTGERSIMIVYERRPPPKAKSFKSSHGARLSPLCKHIIAWWIFPHGLWNSL